MKKKQVTQDKCIYLCLKINSRQHIKAKTFTEKILLPTKEGIEQRVTAIFLEVESGIKHFIGVTNFLL